MYFDRQLNLEVDSHGSKVPLRREILYYDEENQLKFRQFSCEKDLHQVIDMISFDLSEPYSIYTYRYFLYKWPDLSILAFDPQDKLVACIVNKIDEDVVPKGYIGMLSVDKALRRKGIASVLVKISIELMKSMECQQVVLETEVSNEAALGLYEKLGFCRHQRLIRYYLNGADAYRLKLWLPTGTIEKGTDDEKKGF